MSMFQLPRHERLGLKAIHRLGGLFSPRLAFNCSPYDIVIRYCVRTTATWDQFWNIIKKA